MSDKIKDMPYATCEQVLRLRSRAIELEDHRAELVEALQNCACRMEADWRQIDSEWGPTEGGMEADIKDGFFEEYRVARNLLAKLEKDQ